MREENMLCAVEPPLCEGLLSSPGYSGGCQRAAQRQLYLRWTAGYGGASQTLSQGKKKTALFM